MGACFSKKVPRKSGMAELKTPAGAQALEADELEDLMANMEGFWEAKKVSAQPDPYFGDDGLFGPYTYIEISSDGNSILYDIDPDTSELRETQKMKLEPKSIVQSGDDELNKKLKMDKDKIANEKSKSKDGSPLQQDRDMDRRATSHNYYLAEVNPKIETTVYLDNVGTRLTDNAILVFASQELGITNDRGWTIQWHKTKKETALGGVHLRTC